MSEKWYFSEEQLANSPSRKCGINSEMELSYRQRAANLIQEMGQRLQVSQLCINTAIVYMHRFYAFHSFTMFHRNSIAAAAFFLAAKVEEQPRKLEHVIKILNICLEKTDAMRDSYTEQAQELVFNENILLQTLGFDVAIDHPHTHVVKACQLFNIVTVSRELRQTCYFMASNSLHLTTMCLKYRPTVVAAFCIYIACKWSRWEIPDSSEGKSWYSYVDESVTLDTLKKLTDEYLQILERSPSKFKSKMKAITSNGQTGMSQTPSFSGESSTSASRHNNQHHHHHHHHHRNSSSAASGANASSNSNGNSRNPSLSTSSSSSSSKAQLHQMSNSQAHKQIPSQQQQPGGVPIPVVSGSSSSSSSSHMHRPRPSSSGQQQQPPPTSSSQQQIYGSGSSSNSSSQQKYDERQRMLHQESAYYGSTSTSSSSGQRVSDHSKHRMSSLSSQQQQQQPPLQSSSQHLQAPPYMKQNVNDQKQHNVMMNNAKQQQQQMNPAYPVDMHQKSMSRSSAGGSNSSSSGSLPSAHMSQSSSSQKKPPWMQQQQSQHPQMPPHYQNQDKMQYPNLQKNLQMSNANSLMDQSASNMNASKPNLSSSTATSAMSSYNDMKMQQHMQQQHHSQSQSQHQQQQQQQSSNQSQNDFWFNDKVINEAPSKAPTPPRQAKSLFSPSPEQDSSEKAKYMMMTGNLKRENAVDSPKEERKSLTPSKRDKLQHGSQQKLNSTLPPSSLTTSTSSLSTSISMQKDSKSLDALLLNASANSLDVTTAKKRSYSNIKDSFDHSRDGKVRKVEVKPEPMVVNPPLPSPQAGNMRMQQQQQQQMVTQFGALDQSVSTVVKQQPIETNPDIVKSLLKECFSTSNKFDPYDTDSPLDVINPELPDELLEPAAITSQIVQQQQPQQVKRESADAQMESGSSKQRSDDRMDSSAGESRKDHKKKSKKKKEKHKHKKKHKSSDREDRGGDSLKLTLSKDKRDSKSSPESGNNASFNSVGGSGGLKIKIPMKDVSKPEATASAQQPAPIKLKISKEKFSSFTNLNNNNNNNNNNSSSSTPALSSSSSSSHKKKDKDRDKSKSKSSKHSSSSDFKESLNSDR